MVWVLLLGVIHVIIDAKLHLISVFCVKKGAVDVEPLFHQICGEAVDVA